MKIQKATEEDTSMLVKLWEKSNYSLEPKKKMLSALEKSFKYSEIYIITTARPVGYFVITNKKNVTYLNWIAIIQSQKRKGLGKKIMQQITKLARKNKSKKIELAVFSKNFPAISLYTKQNFYVSEFRDKKDKKLGRKLIMEKEL